MGRARATTSRTTACGVVVVLALAAGCGGGGAGPASDLGHPPAVCSTMPVNAGTTAEMEPGGDCIGCHAIEGGPTYLAAGTVMNALHDDTNCAGVEGVTVRLTGSDGQVIEMTTNRTGNFFTSTGALALPFKAQLIRGANTAMMLTPQTDTNCANCHTAKGAKLALGRTLAPAP